MKRIALITALFIALSWCLYLTGCSDNSTGALSDTDDSHFSGVYALNGTQIETRYDASDEVLSADTTSVYFTVTLRGGRPETGQVQFYGLIAADAGEGDELLFPDCTTPDDCPVTGDVLKDKPIIEIQLEQGGRSYSGTVSILNNDLAMYSTYSGQNITKEFELAGGRLR